MKNINGFNVIKRNKKSISIGNKVFAVFYSNNLKYTNCCFESNNENEVIDFCNNSNVNSFKRLAYC